MESLKAFSMSFLLLSIAPLLTWRRYSKIWSNYFWFSIQPHKYPSLISSCISQSETAFSILLFQHVSFSPETCQMRFSVSVFSPYWRAVPLRQPECFQLHWHREFAEHWAQVLMFNLWELLRVLSHTEHMIFAPVLAGRRSEKSPAAQSHQRCKLCGRVRRGRCSVGSALHKVLQLLSPSPEELLNVLVSPSSPPPDTAALFCAARQQGARPCSRSSSPHSGGIGLQWGCAATQPLHT